MKNVLEEMALADARRPRGRDLPAHEIADAIRATAHARGPTELSVTPTETPEAIRRAREAMARDPSRRFIRATAFGSPERVFSFASEASAADFERRVARHGGVAQRISADEWIRAETLCR